MKRLPRHWTAAVIGAAIVFGFSSCAYDPYYTSTGGSYYSDSGYGYGYGGSGFSTSLFVSTGDPSWGYDPYCHSYYDYRSRRYYDPYLYGYYPVGYRPVVVVGAPHPYGWRPGRGYCPPPRTVRNVTVPNYRNREAAYRNSNYSWARQVRAQSNPQTRGQTQGTRRSTFGNPGPSGSSNYQPRNSSYPGRQSPSTRSASDTRQPSGAYPPSNRSRNVRPQNPSPDYRQQRNSRLPSEYNTPVARPQSRQSNSRQADSARRTQPRQPAATQPRQPAANPPARPSNQRDEDRSRREQSRPDSGRERPIRGLGQG